MCVLGMVCVCVGGGVCVKQRVVCVCVSLSSLSLSLPLLCVQGAGLCVCVCVCVPVCLLEGQDEARSVGTSLRNRTQQAEKERVEKKRGKARQGGKLAIIQQRISG